MSECDGQTSALCERFIFNFNFNFDMINVTVTTCCIPEAVGPLPVIITEKD
jgi:hypothetical protein